VSHGYLQTYLNDHFAAASSGVQLFQRVASNQSGAAYAAELSRLAADVSADRQRLRQLMARLDVPENKPKQWAARATELAGRLKPNRSLVRRSPLSDLLEVEALRVAVTAKRAGWRSLLASYAARDPEVRDEVEDLLRRVDDQVELLEGLHQQVAGAVLAGPAD
jgi:hypothetical protein